MLLSAASAILTCSSADLFLHAQWAVLCLGCFNSGFWRNLLCFFELDVIGGYLTLHNRMGFYFLVLQLCGGPVCFFQSIV